MKLPKGLKLPPGEVAIAVRANPNGRTLYVACESGKVLTFQYDPASGPDPRHVVTMPAPGTAFGDDRARQEAEATAAAAGHGGPSKPPPGAVPDAPTPQPSSGQGKPKPGGSGDGKPPPPKPYTVEEWLDLATARFDEWDSACKTASKPVEASDIQCACTKDHHMPTRCWNVADVRALIYTAFPRNYCEVCTRLALQDNPVLLKRDPIPENYHEGDVIT